jgi:hypothetical protein
MAKRYVYSALTSPSREIRLPELLPGQLGQPIDCILHIVAIDEAQPYTALSYTYGSRLSIVKSSATGNN